MKILYHGDSPAVATGFGVVSKNLLNGLAKDHEITVLGINDRGGWKDPEKFPYKIYPAIYSDYNDLFGLKRVLDIINGFDPEVGQIKFDCLIMQYDFTLIAEAKLPDMSFFDMLKASVEKAGIKKKILYTPIDNPLIKPHWAVALEYFDTIVVPSEYAKHVLTSKFGAKWVKERVKVIVYGVEGEVFNPLSDEEKRAMRRSVSTSMSAQAKVEVDLNEKFIVGFVGRNQWRKDYYRIVKTFAKFKLRHENAYLYLHTNAEDTNHDGGNIMELLAAEGLFFAKDYLIPLGLLPEIGLKREQMNEIYNMLDVYFSASMAEGLGLPYLEAMLAEVPVIAPNNTTVPELLNGGRGLIYDTANTVCFGHIDYMRERELGDIDSALEKLEYVYSKKNEAEVKAMTKKAGEFARKITPDAMVKQFSELLIIEEDNAKN